MKKEKGIILASSDEAAKFTTGISGWVDRNGRFWGKDERMARYSGSTHRECDCGVVIERSRSICDSCRSKKKSEAYSSYKFEKWNGKETVYSELCDRYFNDPDEIDEYCIDNNIEPKDLMLVLCIENHFRELDEDFFCDEMPDDGDGELPKKLQEAIFNLNEVIKTLPAPSVSPSIIRTEL